jgi:transposase
MPRTRRRLCYVNFSEGTFHCPMTRDGKITQPQIDSIWLSLPTTGAAWVERGSLFAQARDGGTVFKLGEVAPGADPRKSMMRSFKGKLK